MFKKIARVMVLSVASTVLPGLIVACSGGDAGSATDKNPTAPAGQTGEVVAASSCVKVAKHDDAKCKGGYSLLDEIND